jgi:putative ABC transport system substrate-binding protein
MKRREFIAGVGSAAAWPVVARAQQPALPVVGFLSSLSAGDGRQIMDAFSRGLNEVGYVVGRNALIESRFAAGQYDRLPALQTSRHLGMPSPPVHVPESCHRAELPEAG